MLVETLKLGDAFLRKELVLVSSCGKNMRSDYNEKSVI